METIFSFLYLFLLLVETFTEISEGRGFEYVIPEFELVTRGFQLVSPEFELMTRRFELLTRGFEFVTR